MKSFWIALLTAALVCFVLPRLLAPLAEWVAGVFGALFLKLYF